MDVYMPKMDGFETTQQIVKTYQPQQRPKIIALTNDDTPECRQRCLDAGMNDFSRKGISKEELKALLEKWTIHESGGLPAKNRKPAKPLGSKPPTQKEPKSIQSH